MALGSHQWVSKPPKVKKIRSKKTVKRRRQNGGRQN
jgi:hypothetical protein